MYTPVFLDTKEFFLRDVTSAKLSSAEAALIRAEAGVLASPYRDAVRRALANIEAIASMRVDGGSPKLADLLRLEVILSLHPLCKSSNSLIEKELRHDGIKLTADVIEAHRYIETIDWISKTIHRGSTITVETILELRRRCLYGPGAPPEDVSFRKTDYTPPANSVAAGIYQAPSPEKLPLLMQDYCNFLNKETFTPAAQAALSHFHFESIKPFENKLDRLERIMSHVVFYRRDTVQWLIAPLAILPAMQTEAHVHYILPYNVGLEVEDLRLFLLKERLIEYCASATDMAAQTINIFFEMVVTLEQRWRVRVGRAERGSALDQLLYLLPGIPMITVSSAMQLIKKSFSATNDAITHLRETGILKEIDRHDRNHIFCAQEAIDAFESREQSIIHREPITRDALYTKREGHAQSR